MQVTSLVAFLYKLCSFVCESSLGYVSSKYLPKNFHHSSGCLSFSYTTKQVLKTFITIHQIILLTEGEKALVSMVVAHQLISFPMLLAFTIYKPILHECVFKSNFQPFTNDHIKKSTAQRRKRQQRWYNGGKKL